MLLKNPSSRPHQWFFAISAYLAVLTIMIALNWVSDFDGISFLVLLPVSWALLPAMLFRFHALIATVPEGQGMQNAITAGFLLAGLLLLAVLVFSLALLKDETLSDIKIAALLHPLFVALVIASIVVAIFQFKRWCMKIPSQKDKKRFVLILYGLTAFYILTLFLYVWMPESLSLNVMLLPPVFLLPWYSATTYGFARKISTSPNDPTHTATNLFKDLQQIIFICNKESVVVQTNQFSVGLLGKRMEEVAGANVVDLFSGHDQVVKLIDSAFNSGHSEVKEMNLCATGENEVPVRVSCVLLVDRFNDLFGFAIYGQDYREVIRLRNEIKQRKQAESELSRMSKNLNLEAEKRTAEIRNSVEQLNLIVTERKRDEEILKMEIGEMEVMLNEMYTRVTKNIGLILTILDSARDLKFGAIDQFEKKRLSRLIQRIDAILLVNKQLMTDKSYGMVDFKQFLELLLQRYSDASGNEIEPEIFLQAADKLLWIDLAVPLALVANELVANAVTYAFKNGTTPKPMVWIEYAHEDDTWCHFMVKDNGSGLIPAEAGLQYELSGLKLAELLVKDQLNGSFQISNAHGLSVSIRIPLNELRQGHIGILR